MRESDKEDNLNFQMALIPQWSMPKIYNPLKSHFNKECTSKKQERKKEEDEKN